MTAIALLGALGLIAGVLLVLLAKRLPASDEPLVTAINAALPQTQCAQCGYPGCLPYARAIVAGAASIDLCPPGGERTREQLAELTGANTGSAEPGAPVTAPVPVLARIDEERCIGCARCLPACPVDAIVGAAQFTHTVIADECTGCELCLAPCPVDCIALVAAPAAMLPDIAS